MRSVYDAAVQALCEGAQRCIQLSFYAEGDPVPSEEAFRAVGFRGYRPLAVYWGGDKSFTTWDCEHHRIAA